MEELKINSANYFVLNKDCCYKDQGVCSGEAEMIRVTVLSDGDLRVAAMCIGHSMAEKELCISDGFIASGKTERIGFYTDSRFINKESDIFNFCIHCGAKKKECEYNHIACSDCRRGEGVPQEIKLKDNKGG